MARDTKPSVHIERLSVRVPGASVSAGRRIAERVGHELGSRIAGSAPASAGAIDVRVRVPGRAKETAIVDSISRAIADALARRTGGFDE